MQDYSGTFQHCELLLMMPMPMKMYGRHFMTKVHPTKQCEIELQRSKQILHLSPHHSDMYKQCNYVVKNLQCYYYHT